MDLCGCTALWRKLSRVRVRLLFWAVSFGWALPALAQGSASDGEAPQGPSVEQVESLISEVRSNPSLSDSERSQRVEVLEQALKSLKSAREHTERNQSYEAAIDGGARQLGQLERELQRLQREKTERPPLPEDTSSLRQAVESIRAELALARNELARVEEELLDLPRRSERAATRIPEAESELASLRESGSAPDSGGSGQPASREILRQARQADLSSELEMWVNERLSKPIREKILEARKALSSLRIERLQARLERLERALGDRVTTAADEIRASVAGLAAKWPEAAPSHRDALAELGDWADELERAARAAAAAKSRQDYVKAKLQELTRDWEAIQEQLALGLGGRDMVQVIVGLNRRCRRTLRNLGASAVAELEQARLGALRLRQRIQRPEAELPITATDPMAEALRDLRRKALAEVREEQGRLIRSLVALRADEEQLKRRVEEILEYIDEQLFGVRLKATPPWSLETLRTLPAAVVWWFDPAHGQDLVRAVSRVALRIPGWTVLVALFTLGLLLVRRLLYRALDTTVTQIRRASTDRYGATLAALGCTLLLAAPAPLVSSFVGATLPRWAEPSDWLWGFAGGLRYAGLILAGAMPILYLLLPSGLGVGHFGWKKEPMQRLRWTLGALLWVYVPALVVTLSCSFGDASQWFASLGRTAFLVAHLWMAVLTWRLFHSKYGLPGIPNAPSSLVRWRPLWALIGIGGPLALVGLAAAGYLITALMLSLGLCGTFGILAAGAVAHGLSLRWFNMKQRRIAVTEALERRRAKRAAKEGSAGDESSGVLEGEELEPNLNVVTKQARDLLRAVFGVGTFLTVVWFWSASFPVIQVFGGIRLSDEGGPSLFQVLWSVLVGVVSWVIVRNLPGFLELAVFRTSDLVPGTRVAIYKLCQYGVAAVGAGVALDALQIDWEQFSWIAAALSVGLGFGLQEVVANFVCGIIILFERPIRVGDIVTVEGTTGTVSKIQMRSTTITNWDRQEFVVPNKTLITSTLLNWTLSAPLNRIVIPVGVAYGSDVDQALALLVRIAKDHPRVLDEPEPMATFEQFGDSSLTLYMRAFLPDMDNRLLTITELHNQVHRRFAEAGIEIAFPQRDLHIRSGWPIPTGPVATGSAAAAEDA